MLGMKYQEYIKGAAAQQVKDFFTAVKKVPADKLEWKPLDMGRSVLSQCQEIAMSFAWSTDMLQGKAEFSEEAMAADQAEMAQWTTVEECEKQAHEKLAAWQEFVSTYPDEKLSETLWLPFDGGRDFTMSEIMEYPRWNAGYHEGQVNYIQTLYGDNSF